jgi:hypothetical protein
LPQARGQRYFLASTDIRNKIYTLLKNRMKDLKKKTNYMSVPAAIRELEKILARKYCRIIHG